MLKNPSPRYWKYIYINSNVFFIMFKTISFIVRLLKQFCPDLNLRWTFVLCIFEYFECIRIYMTFKWIEIIVFSLSRINAFWLSKYILSIYTYPFFDRFLKIIRLQRRPSVKSIRNQSFIQHVYVTVYSLQFDVWLVHSV